MAFIIWSCNEERENETPPPAEIPPPTITSFVPESGTVGSSVTINGTNFSNEPDDNTVVFGNESEVTITNASTESLTVTVPQGAETGKISVTVNGKTATSANDFTVEVPDLAITSFTPSSGNVGASVTITGTSFNPTIAGNTVIFYDNKKAVVTSAFSNSLTVTVPQGVETGKISVTVNEKTATSANDFTVVEQNSSVRPCKQNMELGLNEQCSLSFASGDTVTFSVDNQLTACLDDTCDKTFIEVENVERCHTEFIALKYNEKWLVLSVPQEKPTIGGGCAQCEGSLPESCLGEYITSGNITSISNNSNNSWQFIFTSDQTYVSGKDSDGNKKQLYLLYNESSNLDVSDFSSGIGGPIKSPNNPGVKIYVLTLPRFTGTLSCDKNLEFAFIARSPYKINEKQNPTYQTYKGADFCNTTVSLEVKGK
ncbi:MAG: IPT/TIG domain-containing protein [Ekhidna sp.]|nr:IPT/TIG domain-containing protein [Ekhidna sp.]